MLLMEKKPRRSQGQLNPPGSAAMMVWHGFTTLVCTSNKHQTPLLLVFPFLKFYINMSKCYLMKYFYVQKHMKSFDQMPLWSYKDLSLLFCIFMELKGCYDSRTVCSNMEEKMLYIAILGCRAQYYAFALGEFPSVDMELESQALWFTVYTQSLLQK